VTIRARLLLVLAWNLMVPPLVYNKTENQFRWVIDAPLVQWYHRGQFQTLGECHTARADKIAESERWLAQYGKQYDQEGFMRADLAALRNARCLSDQEIK
jgi:hypothetical protein